PKRFGRGGKLAGWLWSHRKLSTLFVLLAAFVLFNGVAFMHARAMTHYADGGSKTARPQNLGLFGKLRVLLTGVNVPRPINSRTPAQVGLPFEVCRFPADDGGELEAWHIPHARATGVVLLFHGYACCKTALLQQAHAFHDLGYAALLVDFRGAG